MSTAQKEVSLSHKLQNHAYDRVLSNERKITSEKVHIQRSLNEDLEY